MGDHSVYTNQSSLSQRCESAASCAKVEERLKRKVDSRVSEHEAIESEGYSMRKRTRSEDRKQKHYCSERKQGY